ncbi:hypothetical protein [Luteolibacter sp. Populi]|uniref:hypothetical protein n=1 Tax=Luteolibacter sp. Populi TaxID=3230487 RepID=UPI00346710D1
MHRFYFPACPVDGPIDPPAPFGHFGSRGCIPNKCKTCACSFEGGCTRSFAELNRYMHLDFGPCGIHGPTDPVHYEDSFIVSKVEIPRKCAKCPFLFNDAIRGFECRKDEEKWGDCRRGLDWGAWRPVRIYVELPHPKVSTKSLVEALNAGDLVGFLKEYRRSNPGVPYSEAKEDFARLRALISGETGV